MEGCTVDFEIDLLGFFLFDARVSVADKLLLLEVVPEEKPGARHDDIQFEFVGLEGDVDRVAVHVSKMDEPGVHIYVIWSGFPLVPFEIILRPSVTDPANISEGILDLLAFIESVKFPVRLDGVNFTFDVNLCIVLDLILRNYQEPKLVGVSFVPFEVKPIDRFVLLESFRYVL